MTDDTAKAEVEGVLARLGRAHHDRDADAIAACYAADAVLYDLAPPLSSHGADRDGIAAWLETWEGPLTVEAADLAVVVEGDLALVHALTRMAGRKVGGGETSLWFRATHALRRTADGWRIVHQHASVPFLMDGSFRAALDLTPEDDARTFAVA